MTDYTQNPLQGYQNTMQQYITGVQNYPQNQANYVNTQIGNTNLTGASNQYALDYNTFSNMFQNDPMGQQYMTQNFNNAGAVGSPTGTPVNSTAPTQTPANLQGIIPNAPTLTAPTVTSTLPQLTPSNVMSGWQGFTNPVYAADARNQSLSNVSGVMNAIQGLIGTDWNAIQSGVTQEGQKQQSALQGLLSLAGMYMNEYNAQASAAGAGGSPSNAQLQQQTSSSIKADVQRGATLQQLMQKYVPGQSDADSVMQIYRQYNYGVNKTGKFQAGKGGWGDPTDPTSRTQGWGVNMKNFATTETDKQKATDNAKIGALKGMGDMINSYYQGSTDIGGLRFNNPINSQYNPQKDIYMRQLSAALKASKSTKTIDAFAQNLPGDITFKDPEAAFKGHLKQVMDSVQLKLVKDKSGNVFVVDYGSYDPSSEQQISVDNLNMNQVQQLLTNL